MSQDQHVERKIQLKVGVPWRGERGRFQVAYKRTVSSPVAEGAGNSFGADCILELSEQRRYARAAQTQTSGEGNTKPAEQVSA